VHWESVLRQFAATQHNHVARHQRRAIGISSKQWSRARENGRWVVVSDHVIRLGGAPPTEVGRALAGVLDAGPGTVLFAGSTLALFGLRGFNLADVHVARARELPRGRRPIACVHIVRDLRACDITTYQDVATVTPLRAIWAFADSFAAPRDFERGVKRVGRILDDAHGLGVVTWPALHRSVDELGRRGRGGTRIMRELTSLRPIGSSPTESTNEDRFEEIMKNAGRTGLLRQVWTGGDEPIGRVDYRDQALPLVVEVNSLRFHTTPSDQAADEERYARHNAAGFMVGVVWDIDIWSHRHDAINTVDVARKLARAGECSVIHSPSCPWPGARKLEPLWKPARG
jgi:hypothetical protein